MKLKSLFLFAGLLICNLAFAQNQEKYAELVKEARQLYQSKEYLKSGQKYSEAFAALGNKGFFPDRFHAACSWALADKADSAFVQLQKIAQKVEGSDFIHLIDIPDLKSLHSDKRWEELTEKAAAEKLKAEAGLNKPLIAILDTIFQEDQMYRQQIPALQEKFGWESDEVKALWEIISEKDSENFIKVQKILDEHGWLGPDVIGFRGNETLFLVIQHSDLENQEKYLPMMREAVKKGNANASGLALLEDRVALRQGKKQIYGSQIGSDSETQEYYVLPLEDPENVDKRREKVGLEKLQDYVSRWGITWNVEEYKKKLPEIEAKQKK